jgi:stalled ribosome rescue protein Dom34
MSQAKELNWNRFDTEAHPLRKRRNKWQVYPGKHKLTSMKATKLGIWMDHECAYLIEFTVSPMHTKIIESAATHARREESILRGENHLHTKDQHQQREYFKKLGHEIRQYREVVLFGPTAAKRELYNTLRSNHLFDAVTIKLEQADKMTENQLHAFVRNHFTPANQPGL